MKTVKRMSVGGMVLRALEVIGFLLLNIKKMPVSLQCRDYLLKPRGKSSSPEIAERFLIAEEPRLCRANQG
jgi:hypothetical protein